jgi:hypothetical protein
MACGRRMSYEMEQVLPGAGADDPDYDPIIEASEFNRAGDRQPAHRLLLELLAVVCATWMRMRTWATSRLTVQMRRSDTTRPGYRRSAVLRRYSRCCGVKVQVRLLGPGGNGGNS